MKVLFATSGTGGHLFPLFSVAQAIKKLRPGAEFLFAGSEKGIEADKVEKAGYAFYGLPPVKLAGGGKLGKVKAAAALPFAALDSIYAVLSFGPDIVVSSGGYAAGTVCVAASLNRIPVALIEPNAVAGRANRYMAPFASKIFLSLPLKNNVFDSKICAVVGNPLRRELIKASLEAPPLKEACLLIIGGSQGSKALNEAAVSALPAILAAKPNLKIIHQTGASDFNAVSAAYAAAKVENAVVRPFFENMPEIYKQASLAVTRCGAGVLAELALFGIPSIMVPLPGLADDHQTAYAKAYEALGCGVLLPQKELNAESLSSAALKIFFDEAGQAAMSAAAMKAAKPQAAEEAAKIIVETACLPDSPFAQIKN